MMYKAEVAFSQWCIKQRSLSLLRSIQNTQNKANTVLNFWMFNLAVRKENVGFKTLIIVQRDATQNSLFIILQVHSTCLGCQPNPQWVHKTVTTASGIGHIFCATTSFQNGQASLLQ